MRTKMMVALVMLGLVAGIGCQQQRKPKAAETPKGLQRIHFDFDRSEIKSDYKDELEGNAAWLKKNSDTRISIEGHCDERGTEEYNIALGHRRASSAKNYLSSLGVDSGRMSAKSYGEERPLETCHNESCWWKNRRAEFMK
jgi:peptidoglycan-associated lipoprotein